jgi:hypothetical protein
MFEVTQHEYERVMGNDPSRFSVVWTRKSPRHVDLIVTRRSVNPLGGTLPDKFAAEIEKLEGVSAVCAGIVDFQTIEEFGADPIGIQGWPAGNYMFRELKIKEPGRNLSEQDRGKNNVLIGSTLASIKHLRLGQTITLSDQRFQIVGVFESHEDIENAMVIMLLPDAQKVMGQHGKITGCKVYLKDPSPDHIAAVRAEIEGPLAEKLSLQGLVQARASAEVYARGEASRYFRYPPVDNVSWNDGREFCRRLSALAAEKMLARRYRLPTEAEWEYAARAGASQDSGAAGAIADLKDAAWYRDNSVYGSPHPVGQKALNPLGLCDMYGNVAEWCADGYAADYYAKSPLNDPIGPAAAETRVIRGGSWSDPASACRPAARSSAKPDARSPNVGFRVVLEVP